MYRILEKQSLNAFVTKMKIEAPRVAKKAAPGQFVILRSHQDGERIPLTIADYDRTEVIMRKNPSGQIFHKLLRGRPQNCQGHQK